jgi:malate permease and related proteins
MPRSIRTGFGIAPRMFVQILEITAPVFFLALIGYVWRRSGLQFDIAFVSRLSMQVSLPALIFSVLSQMDVDPAAFRDLALASLALYVVIGLASAALVGVARLNPRVYLSPVIFGNTGNVGLPIALFAYGEQGLALAMIVFAVMAVLSFTVGIWLVTGESSPLEAAKQPIFHSAALGILFGYQGWGVPTVVSTTLELVGQLAIPMMLITLGVAVAQLDVRDFGRALWVSVAKAAICAAAAVAIVAAFGLTGAAAGALILQAIMPIAVTNYLLATRYDASPDVVAGLVVVSTLVSIVVLPLALAALL